MKPNRRYIDVGVAVAGHVKVTIIYRGRCYHGVITDMTLYDDYRRGSHIFNTSKQALEIMYNEVKRQNSLR